MARTLCAMSARMLLSAFLVPTLLTASGFGSASTEPGTRAAPSATVDVGLVFAGGPAPAAGATPFLRSGSVTLRGEGGTYEVAVKDGQRTRMRVAAGTHTASVNSGDAMCMDSEFIVAAGQDVPMTVTCSVR